MERLAGDGTLALHRAAAWGGRGGKCSGRRQGDVQARGRCQRSPQASACSNKPACSRRRPHGLRSCRLCWSGRLQHSCAGAGHGDDLSSMLELWVAAEKAATSSPPAAPEPAAPATATATAFAFACLAPSAARYLPYWPACKHEWHVLKLQNKYISVHTSPVHPLLSKPLLGAAVALHGGIQRLGRQLRQRSHIVDLAAAHQPGWETRQSECGARHLRQGARVSNGVESGKSGL